MRCQLTGGRTSRAQNGPPHPKLKAVTATLRLPEPSVLIVDERVAERLAVTKPELPSAHGAEFSIGAARSDGRYPAGQASDWISCSSQLLNCWRGFLWLRDFGATR